MYARRLWPLCPALVAIGLVTTSLSLRQWLGHQPAHCAIHSATGLHCPGCGGTRCAHDLLAGNWQHALGHHALLTMGALSLSAISLYLIVRITILGKSTPKIPNISTSFIWVGLGIIILFTLLRNIPAWPFSLLAP